MNNFLNKVKEIALDNKYKKWYLSIIRAALLRGSGVKRKELVKRFGYVELHHIVPRSFGLCDEKDKENVVFLTAREHFIVHLLMTKMFESKFKNKMVFAFRLLISNNKYQKRYFNSRFYHTVKADRKRYVRLYKGDSVKYVDKDDKNIIINFINDGWTIQMTEEFKIGRVGKMEGKKHSEETKKKMSDAAIGKPKPHLLGLKKSKENIEKAKETRLRNKINNPEIYNKSCKERSKRRMEALKNGLIRVDGEHNGMFGKKHSEETRRLIAFKAKERHRKKLESLNNPSLFH